MKTKLPCGIVRDLLPLYADKLTGAESAAALEAHLTDCDACRAVYREMIREETLPQTELAEIDYLKKVRRAKRRLILGILAAVLVLGIGVFVWLRIHAEQPLVHYDETTQTLIVYGKGGYDRLSLPAQASEAVNLDLEDDRFHLSAYLPALRISERTGRTTAEFLPGYMDRTDKSLAFLRDYLKANAPDSYPQENAEKFVEMIVRKKGNYAYETADDRITLQIGDYYWHRDDLYVLALMDPARVEWQHIGYAAYLADCVNPYGENRTQRSEGAEAEAYYDAYVALGGRFDGTPEDCNRLMHAVAYTCLTEGMGWGTPYESRPVTEYGFYTGPAKAVFGNAMSPAMATSFISWLVEQYGFEKVSAFCFDRASFQQAFGVGFDEAYAAWSAWLTAACAK